MSSRSSRQTTHPADRRGLTWRHFLLGLLAGALPAVVFLGFLNRLLPDALAWPMLGLDNGICFISLPVAAWLVGRRGWQAIRWTAKGYVIGSVATTALLLVVLLTQGVLV